MRTKGQALLGASAILLAAAAVAADSPAGLARCAAIAAPDARLACYDALAGRPAGGVPPAVQASAATAAAAVATPATTPPARPPAAPATTPAATPAASPSPTAADAVAEFGVTRKQPAGSAVLQSIHATVAKVTPDAVGHVYVLLDNGQTWTFTDTDLHVERGDVVTIERGAFGSFTMTTPSRHSYKVRRLP